MSLAGVKGALNLGGSTLVEIQETKVTQLPGDEAIELIVPVRVRLAALAGISRKLMIDWRSIKFDGEFKMKTPLSLRKMMLNKPLKKKP
jgi:hypothetical protein